MSDAENYRFLAEVDAVKPGKLAWFEIDGHDILLCHTKEGFYAIENRCSHGLAALSGGRLRGCRIICPLHGGSFDVRDGSATGKPASRPIRSYPLRIADGRIEILLPAR